MYKNQFEIWGFAKNLTKNRVRSILGPSSIKSKILNGFSTARVDRYLKRTKTAQDMPIPELDSRLLMAHDLPVELDCEFAEIYELGTDDGSFHEGIDTSIDAVPVIQPPLSNPSSTPSAHRPDACVYSERGSRKYVIVVDSGSPSVSS